MVLPREAGEKGMEIARHPKEDCGLERVKNGLLELLFVRTCGVFLIPPESCLKLLYQTSAASLQDKVKEIHDRLTDSKLM